MSPNSGGQSDVVFMLGEGTRELVVTSEVVEDVRELGSDAAVDADLFVTRESEIEKGERAGVEVADDEGAMGGIAEIEAGGMLVATGEHEDGKAEI